MVNFVIWSTPKHRRIQAEPIHVGTSDKDGQRSPHQTVPVILPLSQFDLWNTELTKYGGAICPGDRRDVGWDTTRTLMSEDRKTKGLFAVNINPVRV